MAQSKQDLFGGLFEHVIDVPITSTDSQLIIPNPSNGCYYLVVTPLITAQDAIDLNINVFKAGQLIVAGNNNMLYPGSTYSVTRAGAPDYWAMRSTWVDNTTKNEIIIKGENNGSVKFISGHSLSIIRVKGV